MSRKAFMISISFIVILILALAVLSVGISLSYRFLKKAETMKAQLDAQTEAQIESYLAAGERVIIPITKKTIEKGGAVFGLGVLNVYDSQQTFVVKADCITKYNADGTTDSSVCINDKYEITTTLTELNDNKWQFDLGPNQDKKIAILINLQKPTTGLYSFVINICYDDGNPHNNPSSPCYQSYPDNYGDPQVIYVEVP